MKGRIMGYRSTVAYSIRFVGDDDTKNRQSFYTFIAEAKADEDTALCFQEEDEHFEVDEANLQIRFFADGVKWYEDDYPDVKCHMALIEKSQEWTDDNDAIGGAYARVGENADDSVEEVWGQGDYDWCYLSRQVICDWL